MAKRRRTKRKATARKTSRRWFWRLFTPILLLFLLVGGIYFAYLDYRVQSQFEGKRWELPAHVYARPIELYAGLSLTADSLEKDLRELGYRPVLRPERPGSYARHGDVLTIATRRFTFWDGIEPARQVTVRFAGGTLQALRDPAAGESVGIVRLDPLLIAKIYPEHMEDRILIRLQETPEQLVQGLLAIEDRDFYAHHGVSPKAIARALWADIKAGRVVQGGSTLTQQLVKNFHLSSDKALWRKIKEAAMALSLEWHYDKDEILEAYLNEIYLGQDGARAIHGFGMASHFYFGRPLSELDTEHLALLVGMVKGPSYYDPRRNPERSRQRRDLVLDIWAAQGVVTPEAARRARTRPLGVTPKPPGALTPYPAFMDLVRRQLRRDYRDEDLTSEGLRIFTTLDPHVQARAEQALDQRLTQLERTGHTPADAKLQGAVLVTQLESAEVLAVVGGRDARFEGFNRALDARRQIGSLVKPAVYLTALSQNQTLATLLDDAPLRVEQRNGQIWEPANYDRTYHGEIPLITALAQSYNVATVRLGLTLGLDRVMDTLRRLGVAEPGPAYPSLLLGAVQLSPLTVARMYQTIADGGFVTPHRAIRAVLTSDGQPLQRYSLTVERTLPGVPVYLLERALQEVVQTGTARSLQAYLSSVDGLAGKTGTTDRLRDSWFAGYNSDRLAVVWVGRDDNGPTGLTGTTGALPIWADVMAGGSAAPMPFLPEGVTVHRVDATTGLLAGEHGCEDALVLPFAAGTAPTEAAPCAAGLPGEQDSGNWFRRLWQ